MSVVSFGQLAKGSIELSGGKGASLSDMFSAGFPVPEGFVVCADSFREFIDENNLLPRITALIEKADFDSSDNLEKTSEAIKGLIMNSPFPEVLRQEIAHHYRALAQKGEDAPVAVRSSSTAEDLDDASFAGQQETFLYVLGDEDLMEKVAQCWASLYNSRAIFYRKEKGFDESKVAIAVVVQRMINSEKAGVMFTVNPINNDTGSAVIEAVWGLGEGSVSGLVTPDNYIVNKQTLAMEMEFVSCKEVMVVQSESRLGVVEKPVPDDKMEVKVLTPAELEALVEYGKRLEGFFGKPQDVEWASEEGKIYILQSRPITTLSSREE